MPAIDLDAVDARREVARRENPLIWVGTGAQDASSAFATRRGAAGAGVDATNGSRCARRDRPAVRADRLAHRMWADVDLVLGIGSRIEFPLLQWGTDGVNLIQINTDADELDRHGHRRARNPRRRAEVVPMLLDRLADFSVPIVEASSARASRVLRRHRLLEPQLSYLAAIRDALPADAILVEDATQMTFVAHFAYQFRQPRTFLSTGFAGTLGSASPPVSAPKRVPPIARS
jgi:acetolactate synthase-1/2/3 large subunit